jgi:hypothetical protein
VSKAFWLLTAKLLLVTAGNWFLIPSPMGFMNSFYCLTLWEPSDGLEGFPVQSTKLLLVISSTVALSFKPSRTHILICLRSKTVYVFGNGVSSSTRGRVCLSE